MNLITAGLGCAALFAFASFGPDWSSTPKAPQDGAAVATAQDEKQDPREAQVRELMRMTGAANMGKEVMDQMLDQFEKMGAAIPPGFIAKFKELAKPSELVDMVVPIYLKHVDKDTMTAAMKFFNSDAGQRWVVAQKKIVKESMSAGQAWGRQLGMKVMQELQK